MHELFNQATTQQQFLELLRDANIPHYERNGKVQGVMANETKFRLTRLGIDYESKPIDMEVSIEEQKVLNEMSFLRNNNISKNNDLER